MPTKNNLPKLSEFLKVLKESLGGPYEGKDANGKWNSQTYFGREREDHYPGMVILGKGEPFNLYWGTDWCAISLGHSYAKAAGWPLDWPLPAKLFYTPSDIIDYKAAGMWTDGPNGGQVGDSIFFDWKSDADRLANHVGVVVQVLLGADGRVVAYLVNEGNVGSPSVYRKETMYYVGVDILGFGINEFAPENPPAPEGDEMIKYVCVTGHDGRGDPIFSTNGISVTWEHDGEAFSDQAALGFTTAVPYLDVTGTKINPEILRVSPVYIRSRINGPEVCAALADTNPPVII
jgi:hypothetical protein